MKYLLTFLLTPFICTYSYSQFLDGEWKGSLESNFPSSPYNSEIKLFFQSIGDTNYKVYSYCRGKKSNGEDTIVVAKVTYKQLKKDAIYLEETEVLKPKQVVNNCLVKMNLKILKDKDETVLSGTWQSDCSISGTVIFRKKTKTNL